MTVKVVEILTWLVCCHISLNAVYICYTDLVCADLPCLFLTPLSKASSLDSSSKDEVDSLDSSEAAETTPGLLAELLVLFFRKASCNGLQTR